MLILQRRTNEEIVITVPGFADPIFIKVTKICAKCSNCGGSWTSDSNVKIGVEAHKEITVHRYEIWAENQKDI